MSNAAAIFYRNITRGLRIDAPGCRFQNEMVDKFEALTKDLLEVEFDRAARDAALDVLYPPLLPDIVTI